MTAGRRLARLLLAQALASALPAWAQHTVTQDTITQDTITQDMSAPDTAAADGWRTSASLEWWTYGSRNWLRNDALLNPGNRVARLAADQASVDARLNLRAEKGPWDLLVYPRLLGQDGLADVAGSSSRQHSGSLRLNQGLVRYKGMSGSMTAGRELFTWGPASFRSPSNPFYFDSGRTNPLAATPGIDLVRYTASLGDWRITPAWVFATSQLSPAQDQADTALLKIDRQGADSLVSLVASQRHGGNRFVGGFGQFSPDDAWLVYGEAGSTRATTTLVPGQGMTPPLYGIESPGRRGVDALVGASYTRESGEVLAIEYLHSGSGYTAAEQDRYYQQAARAASLAQTDPAAGLGTLGLALSQAPRLVGRDYLWLNWQSNPQESRRYWRLAWVQNLSDGSGQASIYLERNLLARLSGFVVLVANRGTRDTEYGALSRASVTLGVKVFAF